MRKILTSTAAAIGVLVLIACGAAPDADKPISQGDKTTTTSSAAPAPAKASYDTPTPADFALTVKVTKKECFGSAGCIVKFKVTLANVTGKKFDPDKTYDLTYEIKGTSDPYTNTLEVTGDKYEQPSEEMVDTKSSKAVLKAVITSVDEQ